jgi:hypothetical protein
MRRVVLHEVLQVLRELRIGLLCIATSALQQNSCIILLLASTCYTGHVHLNLMATYHPIHALHQLCLQNCQTLGTVTCGRDF